MWIEIASGLKDALVGLLILFSLTLLVIGWLSYRRTGSPRIRMVTLAFLMFLLKGIFLGSGLIMGWVSVPRDFATAFVIMLAVDVLVLVMLYLALFRRRRP